MPTSFYYYDDDGDDDGILVSWTLQLYGHDADLSTLWTPRSPHRQAVGCDRVEVDGFEYQPADGIYESGAVRGRDPCTRITAFTYGGWTLLVRRERPLPGRLRRGLRL